jgi:tRNA 2-thiouridine synthesizing protein E
VDLIMTSNEVLLQKIELLVEQQRKQEELISELMPIARNAMGVATQKLAHLEEKGYFAFGREALALIDRIVSGFSQEDVRELGDNIVAILSTARSLTRPKVRSLVEEAAEAVQAANGEESLGMLGVLKATRDEDVQRGLAVVIAVLRQIGRGANRIAVERGSAKEQLASRLAPRARKAVAKPVPAPAPEQKAAVAAPGGAQNAEGFLIDPDAWNRELAVEIARGLGIEQLTDRHWQVIEFARKSFMESGQSPNIRKLASGSKVSTKEIYALFQKAPGMTAARIAGIPKPVGCI